MTVEQKGTRADSQARRLEAVGEEMTNLFRRPEVDWILRHASGVNDWSAMQILGHMVEIIPYWMNHVMAMISAAGGSYRIGRAAEAPERLAGIERGAAGDPDEILHHLNEEIRAAADTIRRMTLEERGKTGVYIKGGRITVSEAIERFIVAHAEEHLAQVQSALRL
jgi:uncharacterized damage-inducible protein DinB